MSAGRTGAYPTEKQLELTRDLIRALAGNLPDEEVPKFELTMIRLPEELPLSLPSQLVERPIFAPPRAVAFSQRGSRRKYSQQVAPVFYYRAIGGMADAILDV